MIMNDYTQKKIENILKSSDPAYAFEVEIRQQVDKQTRCNNDIVYNELNEHINAIVEARAKFLGIS